MWKTQTLVSGSSQTFSRHAPYFKGSPVKDINFK